MRIIERMRLFVLALVLVGATAGCGQKGPLRVAEPPAQAAPAAGAEADAERDDDERRPPRR